MLKKDFSKLIANYGYLTMLEQIKQSRSVLFAICILLIAAIMILPMPTMLMDALLCFSIAVTVLILMTVLFIERPLDFSSFPNILLVVTMVRLALNVSTTRLILSNGHEGIDAAGRVVKVFGYFVAKGSPVIGAIMFAILTIINFVVITKGSGRIAEVAARFSLDSMPGKQMAIDADLSSGAISDVEAKQRRKHLEDESSFYGAMDGANKFVRGDAIAGLLITFINFIGGILIGAVQKDMSFSQAVSTYSILTIGDGLVSQIPSLFVSISAGLMVTKSGVVGSVDKAIFDQLGKHPVSLAISSGLIGLMGIAIPGMPFVPFAMISVVCGVGAYMLMKRQENADDASDGDNQNSSGGEAKSSDDAQIESSLKIDEIRLELGYELLALVSDGMSQGIPNQIKVLRNKLAKELGFVLPSVRMVDNIDLGSCEYRILVKDIKRGEGSVKLDSIMVLGSGDQSVDIYGEDTIDPVFGIKAKWVPASAREEAIFKGYTVIEPATVIITHMTEIVRDNITDLLSYGEVVNMINSVSPQHKKLVEELIPAEISIVSLKRVLQGLLSEGISIKDFIAILEAVSELSGKSPSIETIIEKVRSRMAIYLCKMYADENGFVNVIPLSANWEQIFMDNIAGEGDAKSLVMAPSKLQEFVAIVKREYESKSSLYPVILTSPALRRFVRSVVERFNPAIPVISHNEIHFKAKIKNVGQI